jgi:AcrR family transcriptional regulator
MVDSDRILEAARDVFLLDPAAPMSAVAERAGVGMSAVYRRYASKDLLLRRLAADGLRRYIAEVETALGDEGDPWTAFTGFMRRCVDGGIGAMTQRLSGQFTATEEMYRDGRHAHLQTEELLARQKAAGVLREDVQTGDLTLIFELMQAIAIVDDYRSAQLRRRYLTLLLDSLQLADSPPLPGPPPRWEELTARYRR